MKPEQTLSLDMTSGNTPGAGFFPAKQAEMLHRGFVPAAGGTLLVSLFFVAALWNSLSHGMLLGWLAVVWWVVLLRGLHSLQFARLTPDTKQMRNWINLFAWGTAASGGLWGISTYLFITSPGDSAAILVPFFIAGVAATSCALYAPVPSVVAAFLVPVLVPLSIRLVGFGDRVNVFMGAAALVYLAVLLAASRRGHALIWRSLATRLENDRLQHEAEQIRLQAELQYREIFDNMADGLLLLDVAADGSFCVAGANPAMERMTGIRASDALGKCIEEIVPEAVAKESAANYRRCVESGNTTHYEVRRDMPAGIQVFESTLVPMRDTDGQIHRIAGITRDISVRVRMEQHIQAREQQFRTLVENTPDIIARYDKDCRCLFVNPAYSRETGIPVEQVLNKSTDDASIWRPDMPREEYRRRLQQVMHTGEPDHILLEWMRPDGHFVSHEMYVVAEYDAAGQVIGTLAIGRDVTQRKEAERLLFHQASYDTLTALPNRRMFVDRLHEEIARADRIGKTVALLFIDLDRFKEVNDNLGHETGDRLLIDAAHRIHHCVRESDTVARLGGDEFVVILSEVEETSHLARIAQTIIDNMVQPFHLDGYTAYISASIGIACYPGDADNREVLIGCADQAMYAAKEQGRNGYSFFTRDMQEQAQRRLQLANDIHDALEHGELEVWFQPIVDISTGWITKAEALLRWRHPVSGMVPPDQFIPIAEETGAIIDIGDWVFRESARLAKRWLEASSAMGEGGIPRISVNISPRQFARGNVGVSWIEYLDEIGLQGECMVIEITEGLLMGDTDDTLEKLERLRSAGVQLSLDDFGTGYSAMGYLKRFNIDYLKIDRSFVRDLETDPSDRAIAEAIVAMAHRLGLKVVAEGVENVGQRDLLAAVGCEYVQGYLYARPMPAEDFMEFVINTPSVNLITEE